ncbi:MAG: flagellar basal body-associated protein FliL [Candidatus Omnitrophica bacterium]|nr:flagellar basal body-associated protein FliL [Candidatus Omnitrophota bacterium]
MIKNNLFRKNIILFLIVIFSLVGITIPAFAESQDVQSYTNDSNPLKNAVILIIRHAEKPAEGFELSPAGEARAKAYAGYFQKYMIDGKIVKLDYLFSTADSKESHRPRLTIEPLSKALGMKIESRFQDDDFAKLAQEIKDYPHGQNLLICWHHGKIPGLLSALGADPTKLLPDGKWPEEVFCWVMQLRFDENGKLFDARRVNEDLMPGDSEQN